MSEDFFHGYFTESFLSLKSHLLPLAIACIGLILIGYGLISSFVPTSTSSDIVFEAGDERSKTSGTEEKENGGIVVDVSGSVIKPGVYRLSENARTQDAILAAGGFSTDADLDWTQHSLNLAAKVSDGMKLYIPKVGETVSVGGGQTHTSVAGVATTGLVSINSASSLELEALPGIGPVSAGKIIAGRPYGSIAELVSKKAVGKATFEKIKDLISL